MTLDEAIGCIPDEHAKARQVIRDAIAHLREQLEWERDPRGVMRRAGHEEECARVKYPRAFFRCDCDTVRRRRKVEGERLASGLCVSETGSATGGPTPPGAWFQPGRHYCEGALRSGINGWSVSECPTCGAVYTADSYAARGVTP